MIHRVPPAFLDAPLSDEQVVLSRYRVEYAVTLGGYEGAKHMRRFGEIFVGLLVIANSASGETKSIDAKHYYTRVSEVVYSIPKAP